MALNLSEFQVSAIYLTKRFTKSCQSLHTVSTTATTDSDEWTDDGYNSSGSIADFMRPRAFRPSSRSQWRNSAAASPSRPSLTRPKTESNLRHFRLSAAGVDQPQQKLVPKKKKAKLLPLTPIPGSPALQNEDQKIAKKRFSTAYPPVAPSFGDSWRMLKSKNSQVRPQNEAPPIWINEPPKRSDQKAVRVQEKVPEPALARARTQLESPEKCRPWSYLHHAHPLRSNPIHMDVKDKPDLDKLFTSAENLWQKRIVKRKPVPVGYF
ncbi:hypothetical protein K490DRAFT_66681 [Saccharata proteae CBS 121410]|uniref:Uncharacterized protein n=1 Tax=Saccharata proteae CBS 121410 TaxID=1314787 RepID=A0A9P4LWH5_9PEZI|nr:hypothetical protein K490DRAFT_66681 [Saccharata proteae CBS 121410]